MIALKPFGDRSLMSFVVAYWPIGLLSLRVTGLLTLIISTHCSSVADSFSLEVQESEENFDLPLIAALEIDIIPQLGDSRIPDSLVTQLAKVLRQGSRLHDSDVNHDGLDDFETVDMSEYSVGSTASGAPLPRERFSYWCFDLLFLMCSDTAKGNSESACHQFN